MDIDSTLIREYAHPMNSTQAAETALHFFHEGYSCAQSVLAPFAGQLGISTEQALRLSSAFGAGLGRMRGTCGALSSLCMIAGHCHGNTEGSVEGKEHIYTLVRSLADDFRREFGSITCRELLHLDNSQTESARPQARSDSYYASRPCERCVAFCARKAQNLLSRGSSSLLPPL